MHALPWQLAAAGVSIHSGRSWAIMLFTADMRSQVFLNLNCWHRICASWLQFFVFGCALAFSTSAISKAEDSSSLAASATFMFREGQLVDQVAPAQMPFFEEVPVRLPAPSDANPPEQNTSCIVPFNGHLTPNPTAAISNATAALPQYLPEGMLPAITGPTGENHRAYAIGKPLEGTSWLAAPYSAGFFVGGIGGAMLVDNQLEQSIGGTFGLRFGVDYDHRWGLEKRFGFAEMGVFDVLEHQRQIVNLEMGDIDLLFYPWGDTRWRPYMSGGAGLSHFNYESDSGRRIDRLLFGLPFGMGVKYFWSEGISIRAELIDNLMLGAHELSTMNNISVAAGIEFRYSGLHLGRAKG
ncbi:porin family protein [Anatilimnocola floriformis]|uniref:porin family protein n=1 Tax=Anatilimnocola floriformis TaxID=2948575 RepID=UPI0020C1BF73|nr:porin family protein [Anatilimnocola floriformis]